MGTQPELILGDNIEAMRKMESNSFDAVVTDPPYGIRFMGEAWDGEDILRTGVRKSRKASRNGHYAFAAGHYSRALEASRSFQAWTEAWAREALRVTKPGGHVLSFCSPRTSHRMIAGLEDAGWEIRDVLMWIFGSGMPHSHKFPDGPEGWEGFGTNLKPGYEPICLAMKPIEGSKATLKQNAEEWGCAGLNVEGCKVGLGRYPANLCLDSEAAQMLDQESGQLRSGKAGPNGLQRTTDKHRNTYGRFAGARNESAELYGDEGGASRFFYVGKAHGKQRGKDNTHPTVKPLELMRWLVRLVSMPNVSRILDPFMGSGTTGVACVAEGQEFVGLEREARYFEIAERRVAAQHPVMF